MKRLSHRSTQPAGGAPRLAALLLAALLMLGTILTPAQAQELHTIKIRFDLNGTSVVAALEDNASTRSFVAMLPLTLKLDDYAGTEKIAYLPEELDIGDAPEGITPRQGDLTYYAPWGNLAIFIKDFRHSAAWSDSAGSWRAWTPCASPARPRSPSNVWETDRRGPRHRNASAFAERSTAMTAWPQTELQQIAEADDLHIAPFREDGTTYGTPTWIWSVAVDGDLYVRAYNGVNSRWYRAAMAQGAGRIAAAGLTREVRFAPVEGDTNDRIDAAYQEKYAGSPYLAPMIGQSTRAATVRISPRTTKEA